MKAIDTLATEHGLIRRFLDTLAGALDKIEHGEKVPKTFFQHAVLFSREFVDKYHHFKEELQMFTLLAQKHAGQFDAPIEALRNQHETGRNHVAAIDYAKEGYESGQEAATNDLLEHLASYISMLRQHINREDHRFYPLAFQLLDEDDTARLMVEFERVNEKFGADFLDKSRDRVAKMAALVSDD